MFKNCSYNPFIPCFILFVFLTSSLGLAESISQKVIRLRRQKKAGLETEYVRSKDVTDTGKSETKIKPETAPPAECRQTSEIKTAEDNKPAEPIGPAESIGPAAVNTAEEPAPEPVITTIKPAREVVEIDLDDPLNLVPAGALLCVRINNFGDSLAKLDQYLMGVSPMPLSMLAT